MAHFDINTFKKMEDEKSRFKYASANLKDLGVGGSRSVFLLSSRFVLKIAMGERGKSQNATEAAISEDAQFSKLLARVHSHAADFSWIVSDLVRPLRNEQEFESFVGMPFEEFISAVKGRDYHRWVGNPKWKVSGSNAPHRDETVGTYGLLQTIRDMIQSKKLYHPELNKIEHWGKTGDDRIVLLDYGVDEKNWKQQTRYVDEGNFRNELKDLVVEIIRDLENF